eukprot:2717982-Alexandrium_andersonii.AAC.1
MMTSRRRGARTVGDGGSEQLPWVPRFRYHSRRHKSRSFRATLLILPPSTALSIPPPCPTRTTAQNEPWGALGRALVVISALSVNSGSEWARRERWGRVGAPFGLLTSTIRIVSTMG